MLCHRGPRQPSAHLILGRPSARSSS
jgi:hypothetical protein